MVTSIDWPRALIINHCYSGHDGIGGLTADEIDRHLHLNTRAPLLLIQEWALRSPQYSPAPPGVPPGDETGPTFAGTCVFMTSGQDKASMPGELAYAASKGALTSILPSLCRPLGRYGLTLTAVDPGPTDSYFVAERAPEAYALVKINMPRKRWGKPSDAARLVSWLASEDAAWVTGQLIHSDGGFWD